MQVGQIRIEWRWVSLAGIETPYRHMYLVFRPEADSLMVDWMVIRAGPTTNNPAAFGLMTAEINEELRFGEDKYNDGESPGR